MTVPRLAIRRPVRITIPVSVTVPLHLLDRLEHLHSLFPPIIRLLLCPLQIVTQCVDCLILLDDMHFQLRPFVLQELHLILEVYDIVSLVFNCVVQILRVFLDDPAFKLVDLVLVGAPFRIELDVLCWNV